MEIRESNRKTLLEDLALKITKIDGEFILFIVDPKEPNFIYGEHAPDAGSIRIQVEFGSEWSSDMTEDISMWSDSYRGSLMADFAIIETCVNQMLLLSMCNYKNNAARSGFYEYLDATGFLQKVRVLKRQGIIKDSLRKKIEKLTKVRNKLAHRILSHSDKDLSRNGVGGPEKIEGIGVIEINGLRKSIVESLIEIYRKAQPSYVAWINEQYEIKH